MKDVQGIRFTKDGLTFKASQLKRGMTFAKMDSIIRRNAEKAQQAKTNGRLQSTHYELPKQEANPELAEQLGKTEHTISRWCQNKTQPSIAQLNEIARVLMVDVRSLINPSQEEYNEQ
jgi:transcriptional regulator with XRE-family HTH domain